MKTPLSLFTFFSASLAAQAAVYTGNILLSPNPGLGAEYALTVFQDPQATNPTTILFNYTDAKLIFVNSNIDEGSDWYHITASAVFLHHTIANGDFTVFIKSDFSGFTTNPIDAPTGRLFLGVNTGIGFSDTGPNRQFYGWVALESDGDTLSLVESAITYDQPGIVTGTPTTIPEPSSTLFIYAGVCAVVICSKRRKAGTSAL